MDWLDARTAPDNEIVLAAWPMRLLDEDDMPTGAVVAVHVITAQRHGDTWDDLGGFDGIGRGFDDDHEPVESPTHWMPLPAPPAI